MIAQSFSFWRGKNVLVTGADGFIGSHLVERLCALGAIVRAVDLAQRPENLQSCIDQIEYLSLDLTRAEDCSRATQHMSIVLNLAAKVGGIALNNAGPGEMFRVNSMISLNMLEASRLSGVGCHLVVSSACVYRRDCPIPTPESEGFVSDPEQSNFGYGWAKRLAEVHAQTYARQYNLRVPIARPFNAYGPRDSFNENGHVIASLIHRACDGQSPLTVWGSGRPTRSFLFVADFVDGLLLVAEKGESAKPYNLCDEREVSIAELAEIVVRVSGSSAKVVFDASKPDGQPRRLGDASRARSLGFRPRVTLEDGVRKTIAWYRSLPAKLSTAA